MNFSDQVTRVCGMAAGDLVSDINRNLGGMNLQLELDVATKTISIIGSAQLNPQDIQQRIYSSSKLERPYQTNDIWPQVVKLDAESNIIIRFVEGDPRIGADRMVGKRWIANVDNPPKIAFSDESIFGHIVKQNECIVTYGSTLCTFGLSGCVALGIYDSENHVISLAHLDDRERVSSNFNTIIFRMRDLGAKVENMKAIAVGGSSNTFNYIKRHLDAMKIPLQEVYIDMVSEERPVHLSLSSAGLLKYFAKGSRFVQERVDSYKNEPSTESLNNMTLLDPKFIKIRVIDTRMKNWY